MTNEVVLDALRDKIATERRSVSYLEDRVKYLRKQAREAVAEYRWIKRLLMKSRGTLSALVKAKEDLR